MTAAWIVGAALGVALLGFLHHAFWSRWLAAPPADDARLAARTRDGWQLELGRRLPRGAGRRPPVLLCHGLSANRWFVDAGIEGVSLAGFLAREGFDCFALDLRGHGGSRRAPPGASRDWTFDTYLRQDVPAALDAVAEATGEEQVLWVGHSLGALLGMAACQAFPDRIAGLAAVAGPVRFGSAPLALASLLRGRHNRLLAAMAAPFAGLVQPRLGEMVIASRNVERRIFRRLLANGVEGVPPGVLGQVAGWARRDVFASADGATDYRAGLAACRQPALFVSAARDGLAPRSSVLAGHDLWGGEKATWNAGLADGLSADYGHSDLLLGRRASEEVFPRLRDWLLAHSQPRR